MAVTLSAALGTNSASVQYSKFATAFHSANPASLFSSPATTRSATRTIDVSLDTAGQVLKHSKPLLRVGGKLARKIPYVGLAIGACMDGYELYKAKTEGGQGEFEKEIKGVAIEWGCTAIGTAIGAGIGAVCTEGLGTGVGAEIGGTVGAFVGMFLRGKTFTERQEEQREFAANKPDNPAKGHDKIDNNTNNPHKENHKPMTTSEMFATLRCTYVPGIYCQRVDDNGGYTKQKHYFYDLKNQKFVEIPKLYYVESLQDIQPELRNNFLANGLIPDNISNRNNYNNVA